MNRFQEGEGDKIQIAFESWERMLTIQKALSDSLVLPKGYNWMIMMIKDGQGTLERTWEGK